MSWTRTFCACATLAVASSGCANLLTSRAIDKFSESLAEGDTEQLRELTSERFAQNALRLPEAGDDFKVLNLPKGKLTVLQTKDISEDKKHVTVQVGDSEEKNETLEFHLTRPPGERRWVVDDVFITQKGGGGRGESVTKSVTEQMDLLLTVREFLAAWDSGSREDVLAITADELRVALEDLPPAYLEQVTSQTVDDINRRSLKPQARLDGDNAIVTLSRSRGGLMISLTRKDDRWLVTDVKSESREGEQAASVKIMAGTLQTAVKFLNAYAANDRAAITAVADPAFERKLAGADLTTIPLPVAPLLASPFKYMHHGDSVDLVVPHGGAKYVVSLQRQIDDKPKGLNRMASFLVSEVTLHESGSTEVKRLSALFTVNAIVEVYAEALIARDRSKLIALSTQEFNDRAWSIASDVILEALPLPEIEEAPPRVVATVYQGPVTEVTVTQGTRALTYVLHSGRGAMQVDDVLLPVTGRSNSLKANIELLAPLYGFALGVHHHDMELLKKTSGTGLARMVWAHTSSVPDVGVRISDYFALPIRSIKSSDNRSLVELSDGTRTARAILVREGRHIVVQDVQFEAGKGPDQQVQLLQAMRDVLAQRNLVSGGGIGIPRGQVSSSSAPSGVISAGGPLPRLTNRRVTPASFDTPIDTGTR